MKMLGKNELELFEKMCSLCINETQIPEVVFSRPEGLISLLDSLDIDFGSLQFLQILGLFLPNGMSKTLLNPEKKNFAIHYFDKTIRFKPENNDKLILPAFYELSIIGKQIISHLSPQPLNDYFNWLKEGYKVPNYRLIE
jgi:hypothetical protein